MPNTLIGQAAAAMNSGQPPLGQVSNQAPTFNSSLQVPPISPMPNKSPMSAIHKALLRRNINPSTIPQLGTQNVGVGSNMPPTEVTMPQVQDTNQSQPGVQIPVSEAELIIKALTSRLGLIGKHESAIRDHLLPQGVGTNQP